MEVCHTCLEYEGTEEQMRGLALLCIGFDPLWSAWQSPYVTAPKQATKIQKNVSNATVLVYGPF